MKIPEENIRKKSSCLATNNFLDMIPKAKAEKAKTNTWDCIKQKTQTVKKNNNNRKKQYTEWEENISKSYISDKELISKIFLKTHTTQQQNTIQSKARQQI